MSDQWRATFVVAIGGILFASCSNRERNAPAPTEAKVSVYVEGMTKVQGIT